MFKLQIIQENLFHRKAYLAHSFRCIVFILLALDVVPTYHEQITW